jgi:hypothetical protein
MKFAISSHINYIEKTESVIVDSLVSSGISRNDIYLFIGGMDPDSDYKQLDNNKFLAPHNSMDFAAMISILDLDISHNFWFLLHDTCYVGPSFYTKLSSFDHSNKDYVALTYDMSMNMGAYSWNYLQINKQKILSYKNTAYDTQSLQKYKSRLIHEEDVFLKPKRHCYCNTNRITYEAKDYYNNNSTRIIEYFPDIDLYKVKANWYLKPEYVIKL